mgnify:CR=1 FL=1
MNKVIKSLLPLIFLSTTLVGCNNGSAKVEPINPIGENEFHKVEGTLHKVNVTEGTVNFIEDTKTDFRILVPNNDSAFKAASFIGSKITEATGVSIDILTFDNTYQYLSSDKLIVLSLLHCFITMLVFLFNVLYTKFKFSNYVYITKKVDF